MAKTSYQKLGILFSDREMALPPSTEISVLTFVVKKSMMKLAGVSIFRDWTRKLLTVRPLPRIYGCLLFDSWTKIGQMRIFAVKGLCHG